MKYKIQQLTFKELNDICERLCHLDSINEDTYSRLFTTIMQTILVSDSFTIQILEALIYIKETSTR